MKLAKVSLVSLGIMHILIGVLHCFFWDMFSWDIELVRLSQINSNVMQMLNICMTYIIFFLGVMYIKFNVKLLQSEIGRFIALCMVVFWVIRFLLEFIYPEPSYFFSGIILLMVVLSTFPLLQNSKYNCYQYSSVK